MRTLVHQGLLVLAAAALSGSAFLAASVSVPRGLERLLATAAVAVAAAVSWALVLGRLGLSGSPPAMAAAAAITWLAARAALARPGLPAGTELGRWRRESTSGDRAAAAATLGCALGLAVWGEYRPTLGYDGATYHLSQVVIWAQQGNAGSVEPVLAGLRVGNYPLTNEAALSWVLGLSQSFAGLPLWQGLMLLVFVTGAAVGLRALRIGPPLAALAIACFCTTPLVLRQLVHLETDFPALAWLAACAGLSAAAVAQRQAALLAPALLAGGLAIGTKTTSAPLALLALGAAGFDLRGALRPHARALLVAGVATLVVGGLWYSRNLVQHGSPLWPLIALPWGDPVPSHLERLAVSLLERPGYTLSKAGSAFYLDQLAGLLAVFVAALLSPLWSRRALPFAVAALMATLAWANAPFTGNSGIEGFEGTPLSTLRYVAPALLAATAALTVSSGTGPRARLGVGCVLAVGLGWNIWSYAHDPFLSSDPVLAACVALGAAGWAVLLGMRVSGPIALAGGLAAMAVLLAIAAGGWVERHGAGNDLDAGLVKRFSQLPGWDGDRGAVAASPLVYGALAGNGLEHELDLLPARESCPALARRLRRGWVLTEPTGGTFSPPRTVDRCLRGVRPTARLGTTRIYGGFGR